MVDLEFYWQQLVLIPLYNLIFPNVNLVTPLTESIPTVANFGGSISSILINTPGTNAAAATLIDGYPMCRNGQPRRALDMALVASTFGGLVSAFCLLFFAPQISKVAMKFSSPEYFALAIFGLSVIASVS